jgi:hypothetical protein
VAPIAEGYVEADQLVLVDECPHPHAACSAPSRRVGELLKSVGQSLSGSPGSPLNRDLM